MHAGTVVDEVFVRLEPVREETSNVRTVPGVHHPPKWIRLRKLDPQTQAIEPKIVERVLLRVQREPQEPYVERAPLSLRVPVARVRVYDKLGFMDFFRGSTAPEGSSESQLSVRVAALPSAHGTSRTLY